MSDPAHEQIKSEIEANDVVLFMKGTKAAPACGFSNTVVSVLNHMEIDFKDVNVLADDGIRQGVKTFSDWPTIPQLYVKGEFVGGHDIIVEMTMEAELDDLLEKSGVGFSKERADQIREYNKQQQG